MFYFVLYICKNVDASTCYRRKTVLTQFMANVLNSNLNSAETKDKELTFGISSLHGTTKFVMPCQDELMEFGPQCHIISPYV